MQKVTFYFLFIVLAFASSTCRKDLVIDNSDKNFPITLRMTAQNGVPLFSWDKANHSTFNRYVILSSEVAEIPFGLNPLTASGTFIQKVSFSKRDSTSFVDNTLGFSPTNFYKLYVDIGGRFLESANVQFVQQVQSINGSQAVLTFDKEKSWMVTVDPIFSVVTIFNYATKEIVATTQLPFQLFSTVSCTIGAEGDDKFLYLLNNSTFIKRFSLPNLIQLNGLNHTESITESLVANNNNLLIYTTFDFSQSLIIRRQTSLQKIAFFNRTNYFEKRGLVLVDSATNLMIEYSTSHFDKFTINNATGAKTNLTAIDLPNFDNQDVFSTAPISPNKSFFIPKRSGDVYDLNFNKVLDVNFQQINEAAFSTDGNVVYYAVQDFSSGQVKSSLQKIAFPEGDVLETIDLGTLTIAAIQPIQENTLFVVLRDFNNNRLLCKTIIF